MKFRLCVALLLGLALLAMAGLAQGQDNKQLMMIFTTDTGAELNPCG